MSKVRYSAAAVGLIALVALVCASSAAASLVENNLDAAAGVQDKRVLFEDFERDAVETASQSETRTMTESESESATGPLETPSESETRQPSQSDVDPSNPLISASPSTTQDAASLRRDAVAFLSGVGSQYSSARGNVTFTCKSAQSCEEGTVEVSYVFHNIPAGRHSFNIYEFGSIEDEGRATGRYFLTAPPVRECATPPSRSARAGDLGEITVAAGQTVVSGSFTKYNVFLSGDKSIVGRGIGLDEDPCDTAADGKDRKNVVVGGIGIAQPPAGIRSSASSGAAPSSVKGGSCTFSPVANSGVTGSAKLNLVAGSKGSLQIVASVTGPAASTESLFAQVYTYGDLSDAAATGSTLGGVNAAANIGSRAQLTKNGNSYSLDATYADIDLSGSSSIVGRALVIYTKDAQFNPIVRAACPIALTGPIPAEVCKNSNAANFNQAAPCIMAAKLANKNTKTTIEIQNGPSFEVPAGSLKVDELFIEVYEVDKVFQPPTVGKYSNIDITSSVEFQPVGDHFNPDKLPTINFPVEATKGFNLLGLISQDGIVWELLPNLKYDAATGLTGSVPHFSYVSSGKSKKKDDGDDDNNDVAIGVGVGVGVGGAAVIGAAGFYYYQKNKGSSGTTAAQSDTPLTPQDKYGNI